MFRRWLTRATYRITQWIGRQRVPYSKKLLTSTDFYDIVKLARPGDILCATRYGEISNLFIPGDYKHAAVYVGGEIPTVIEAVGKGVVETKLVDFVMSRDLCVLLRPRWTDGAQAVVEAWKLVGKPYDYQFRAGNDAFYCAELIKVIYGTDKSPIVEKARWKTLVILPQDFVDDPENFDRIWRPHAV